MNRLFLLLIPIVLCVLGCTNKAEKARLDSLRLADSLTRIENARLAAEQAAKDAEKARMDSIRNNALKGDSLKERHIVVDKESLTLYVRENYSTLLEVPVCVGKGIGQKRGKGDSKTPEGTYKVISMEPSSGWTHDFHDGKGKVKGAYGPWFFRLNTPQSTHIGIHGTLFPETMGTRDSDGCVRLRNEDLLDLKKYVFVGMKVVINPDKIPSA